MNETISSSIPKKRWKRMSLVFLSLLPILALFQFVMWFGFTRTLFRPETGDLKRMGYLVGLEDCRAKLQAAEPQSGYTVFQLERKVQVGQVPVIVFGDSFGPSLAKAISLKSGEPVGLVGINWGRGNGISQMKSWLTEDSFRAHENWFRAHGVKTIVLERVEYAWLDTFADEGDATLNIPWSRQLAGEAPALYQKAPRWTFANNGNFKVVFCNFAYLFSPTAFKLTDACVVPLKSRLFNCSYGNKLLFYRGDFRGALTANNQARFELALKHLQELADLCHKEGFEFRLIVPPVKSYLYYDWVQHPFYPDSKLLETLQARAKGSGYVDLKQVFHKQLEAGFQDLYYPDDAHWNFPAAQMAAEETARAQGAPTP